MLTYVAYADGSPTPTLVMDAGLLPEPEDELVPLLRATRSWLVDNGGAPILKFALIRPSEHPMFDLEYRFVQCVPGPEPSFDFRGSCGHSILNSVIAASQMGWLPWLAPSLRARVHVQNNGDHVVCEVDEANRGCGVFTVHFVPSPSPRLGSLLLTGTPVCYLETSIGPVEASLVSAGNPYVFVDARRLGIDGAEQLFSAGNELFELMNEIRLSAVRLLGWDERSVFPKIAAVGAFAPGELAVRAISVPRWHPTLALTGSTCLATAAAIPGTVVERAARATGSDATRLTVRTPGGTTAVSCRTSGPGLDDELLYGSVSRKRARVLGSLAIEPLSVITYRKEAGECLLALSSQ
ncbi:MAG TPA: PrpF domain-containing protein [Actinomycetota bacterium]|nr:PrpF domain-containing protein [Actinomycetota bacterium]